MKSINRIFLLGDSWIEGQGTYSEITQEGTPIEPNLPFGPQNLNGIGQWRKDNSWNKFFKDTFGKNIEICNLGVQGSDNYQQFNFLNFIFGHDYKDTDLILFGFTSKYRDNRAVQPVFQQAAHDDWYKYVKGQRNLKNDEVHFLQNNNPIRQSALSFEKIQIQLELLEKNSNTENIFFPSQNEKALEVLKNMIGYEHYIIANSSLSLIAAYLSSNSDTNIYYPDPWWKNFEVSINEIPPHWIKINNE